MLLFKWGGNSGGIFTNKLGFGDLFPGFRWPTAMLILNYFISWDKQTKNIGFSCSEMNEKNYNQP